MPLDDTVLDEIFGTSDATADPDGLLRPLVNLLRPIGPAELVLEDASGRIVARTDGATPPREHATSSGGIDAATAATTATGAGTDVGPDADLEITSDGRGGWTLRMAVPAGDERAGTLRGTIVPGALDARSRQRLTGAQPGLAALAALVLRLTDAEEALAESDTRNAQLRREREAFLVEHQRVLALSLAEREVRIAEQQQHVSELEAKVRERTRALEKHARALETTNRALMDANEKAASAIRAKNEFLSNMSHEIRTPLNAIIGMASVAGDTALTTEQKECVTTIAASADALLSLVEDVLDFSSLETGRLRLASAPIDVRHCLADSARMLALDVRDKGLELICHVDPEVPLALLGDGQRVRQVLLHLLGNAIKFTERGEISIRVDLAYAQENAVDLKFSIRDTGIGVPFAKQQLIFGSFEQADGSASRRHGGAGLGLTLAHRLVELMRGRLWVEGPVAPPGREHVDGRPDVGPGSVFHFTARFERDPSGPETDALPPELAGLRALVADDNETNLGHLARTLREAGLAVYAAHGGHEALDALAEAAERGETFDLMVLDVEMPDIGGRAVIDRLRSRGLAVPPAVMIAGGLGRSLAELGEELGALVLPKPVVSRDLIVAVTELTLPSDASPEGSPASFRAPPPPRSLHVLLAEDNRINQKLASRLLEREGHRVTVAADGHEALEAHANHRFDLILMDLQMPGMGGVEATRQIRVRSPEAGGQVPIVAFTAHETAHDRKECAGAGMDGFLTKPFRPEGLREVLRRITG